uniref:Uncharacterized protein n=1 Tax=Amphimedon queenslandica TaxID=400682 RepID=A0A1X7UZ41_AMPQE
MADMSTTDAMCIVIALVKWIKQHEKKKRKRTPSIREWINNRPKHGTYLHLINELRLCDQVWYKNFLRMDVLSFESLLNLVSPIIRKQNIMMRQLK